LEKLEKFDQFLSVNQKLLIEVKVGDYPGIFDSRIEDIKAKEKKILLSMPTDKGQGIPLKPNTRVHLSYVLDKGRFSFKSVILDRVKDPLPMLVVQYPEAIFRQELRAFFRVDTRIPVKVMATVKSGESASVKIIDAKIVDISGGGMRLFSEIKMEKNDTIEIYLQGSIEKLESLKALVMRSTKRDGMFETGVRFEDLSSSDRDKIVKYVFKRQVELRKLLG